MPIYEYSCDDCETQFEKFVRSMTANVEVKCPECGGSHVRKGWSVFGTGSGGNGGLGNLSAAAAACSPSGGT
ncbi:MAG: zinc ribbon domain-containing protein [Anaerolineae bacterium]|jgi:putative FmdB family regulatory protein